MAKKSVVLKVASRGSKPGDVVQVDADRAETLVSSGLARAPRPGEVKAAKDDGGK